MQPYSDPAPSDDMSYSFSLNKTKYGVYDRFSKGSRLIPFRSLRSRLRTILKLLCGAVAIFFCYVLWNGGVPPSYEDIWAQERALPQHRWNDPKPGKYVTAGPKYVRFPDHYWGLGLNNILEEALLNCHLVHAANRTYVFEDHVWSHLPSPYTLWEWKLRPVRVPASAFLGGVLVGMDENEVRLPLDQRSISQEYFDHVCPKSDVVEITYGPEDETTVSIEGVELPFPRSGASGEETQRWWVARLSLTDVKDARCVVVNEKKRRLWEWSFYNHVTFLEYFPFLRRSPAFRGFDWSPLVLKAAQRSLGDEFFSSNDGLSALRRPEGERKDEVAASDDNTLHTAVELPRTVAIHLRMGDFAHHCHSLNKWNAPYLSFPRPQSEGGGVRNSDVFDISPFTQPPVDEYDAETKLRAKEAYYFEHCLPTVPQIVKRLHDIRAEYEEDRSRESGTVSITTHGYWLNKVYILTNGHPSVIEELKRILLEDQWEMVMTTPDLEQKWSKLERSVSGATDMSIGEKAEVFVGNGFSSLTANLIMLRRAKGFPHYTHRLL